MKDAGDPLDYVVLTNNDYEAHDDYPANDFDDTLAPCSTTSKPATRGKSHRPVNS